MQRRKIAIGAIIIVLVIATMVHGWNMFKFPYYENDEGTYMSQAWSLLTSGKMAPYTYWYDHSPAGWFLIAAWVMLTGGFFTFGASINSGRVLMLILHVITCVLILFVSKRLTKRYLAGIIAVLVFSLTPLGLYYQRRVLLDNMMIFWVFVALALLLTKKLKISNVVLSGLFFGIGVLTKENAIFFMPAFWYAIHLHSKRQNKSFVMMDWTLISVMIISTYFLYAWLKRELFPVGFGGDWTPHVSLLQTLKDQASRGGGLPFWNRDSEFYHALMGWVSRDRTTMIFGALATGLGLIFSIWDKKARIPAFMALLFWVFLARGKLVIDFYITPIIPLLAFNIGFVFDNLVYSEWYKRWWFKGLTLMALLLILIAPTLKLKDPLTRDENTPYLEAINWIKTNLKPTDNIVIDDSIYVDLHESRWKGDPKFPNADWSWKVVRDPDINEKKLNKDWTNINYIAMSHEILKQIQERNFEIIRKAFVNTSTIIEWRKNSTSFVDLNNLISTNGDWMGIYKVKDKKTIEVETSWEYYKKHFIVSYGQVVDPAKNDATTSEGQSYAMLRAVWLDDKGTFDGVWQWTKDHFQWRTQDKLFSWLWQKDDKGEYKLADAASASDADEDIALALVMGSKQWKDDRYLTEAKAIISDIWKKEVVKIRGNYYLMSGTDAARDEGFLINPSYLSPATYRIFGEIDTDHDWLKLAQDSYRLLNQMTLPRNWVLLEKNSGEILSAEKYVGQGSGDFGYDGFRTTFRVALDKIWFNTADSKDYLEKLGKIYQTLWESDGKIVAIYDDNLNQKVNYESTAVNAGPLITWTITNNQLAKRIYEEKFQKIFTYDEGYWGDKNNYYDQNWAWFATALYENKLPSLWK